MVRFKKKFPRPAVLFGIAVFAGVGMALFASRLTNPPLSPAEVNLIEDLLQESLFDQVRAKETCRQTFTKPPAGFATASEVTVSIPEEEAPPLIVKAGWTIPNSTTAVHSLQVGGFYPIGKDPRGNSYTVGDLRVQFRARDIGTAPDAAVQAEAGLKSKTVARLLFKLNTGNEIEECYAVDPDMGLGQMHVTTCKDLRGTYDAAQRTCLVP